MDGKSFSESVVHFYELYEQHASLFAPRKVTFELAGDCGIGRYLLINAPLSPLHAEIGAAAAAAAPTMLVEEWEDASCATDDLTVHGTVGNAASADELWAEVHILRHPTYEVPCPYFRLSRARGDAVEPDETARLLAGVGNAGCAGCVLVQEEHPVLGSPFFSFHVCGLPALLEAAAAGGSAVSVSTEASERGPRQALLVLLNLLRFIGPALNVELLSTEQYAALTNA